MGREWIFPGELLRDSLVNVKADKKQFLKGAGRAFSFLCVFCISFCSATVLNSDMSVTNKMLWFRLIIGLLMYSWA